MPTKNKKNQKKGQSSSAGHSSSNSTSSTGATSSSMESSQLMSLFEKELKDIYWAEKALSKALPKMIKNATNEDLVQALENHLIETEEQIGRLEEVFESLGKKAVAKKCEAMEGLIKEAQTIMKECEAGSMRDAGIISAAQKIEHYEIASYGTLCAFAETLELEEVSSILSEILEEEKNADETLSEVALTAVNVQAAEQEEERTEEDDEEEEEESEDENASPTKNRYIEL